MSEETYKTRRKILIAASLLVIGIVIAYIAYTLIHVKEITLGYRIVLCVGIFLFWLIQQVITPIWLNKFEGKTPEQKKAYYMQAALGLVGYAGLVYYALAPNSGTGIYGVLVYAGTTFAKRRLYDDFTGESEEDTEDEDDVVDALIDSDTAETVPGIETDSLQDMQEETGADEEIK